MNNQINLKDTSLKDIVLFSVGLTVLLYCIYWIMTGIFSSQLSSPWLAEIGLSHFIATLLTELLFVMITTAVVCIPFGILSRCQPILCAVIASICVVAALLYENQIYLSWQHYFSYALTVVFAIVFTHVGIRLKKPSN